MPITEHPLHRSGRALLMHPAPTSGNDAHSPQRIGMMEFNMRKPTSNMTIHSRPSHGIAIASPSQCTPPISGNSIAENPQCGFITWHPIVSVVASNNTSQPFPLVGYRLMHSFSHLCFQFLELASHFLTNRSPIDRVHLIPELDPTDMGKSKETECLWLSLTSALSVVDRKSTKLQNSSLFRVKLKTELVHSLLKIGQKLLGLRFVFKAYNKVVCPAHDDHFTKRFVLPSLLRPEIKNIVKINIRKQGTNTPTLRNSFNSVLSESINENTRFEPLLDQANHSFIPYTMLDKLDKPFMAQIIEKSMDVSIQHPVHFPRQKADIEGVQATVLPFPRSVSVGETKKIRLVDCIQDFNRSSLDDFIFQNRYPQGTLLPIGFVNEHSSYGVGSIASFRKSIREILEIFFEFLPVAPPRLAINAASGTSLNCKVSCSQSVNVINVMNEVCEPHRFIALGELAYPIKRILQAFVSCWGSQLVLLDRVSFGQTPSLSLLRRHFTAVVRWLRWYNGSVRLPMPVLHRRASLDFTMRTCGVAPLVKHGISRFSRRLFRCMLKVFDPAKYRQLLPLRTTHCCLPQPPRASALWGTLSGLNTRPTSNPVNASRNPLRGHTHDSGTLSMASRLKVKFNINTNLPVYPGAQEIQL